MVCGGVLGGVVEVSVVRPALNSRSVNELTIAIGLFLVISAITAGLFGGDVRQVAAPVSGPPVVIGDVTIPRYGIFVVLCAVVLMLVLWALFRWTGLGLALRASASSRMAADLVGIRTSWMLTVGWSLAGATGAAAGLLLAPIVGLSNQMMLLVLVSALSAVILGGLTSPVGAVVRGVIIGVAQNLVGGYLDDVLDAVGITINDANSYREIAAALLLIVVLVVRPGGLFGRPPAALERV
jgi:branched-chain amino acid transport system permease protein